MPQIPIFPLPAARDPASSSSSSSSFPANPLPQLLHTPSGLAVLELQGSVLRGEGSESAAASSTPALPLGRLVFPPDGKTALLFVGDHQRLSGVVRPLARPLAVLARSSQGAGDGLEVLEIVKLKILFGARPEPMGAPPQQQSETLPQQQAGA